MQANYVQRLRVTFRKIGPTRFIGHLDVARTWHRIINRAKLPVAYTQGFNKQPRISFATATPLGVTSDCELMDILMQEELPPEEVATRMKGTLAPGIEVVDVREVPLKGGSLQSITRETTYRAVMPEEVEGEGLKRRVAEFLAAESWERERRVKKKLKRYDLRPLVLDLQLVEESSDELVLQMRLMLEPSRTGRADEVLRALEVEPLDAIIHRTALLLAEAETEAA